MKQGGRAGIRRAAACVCAALLCAACAAGGASAEGAADIGSRMSVLAYSDCIEPARLLVYPADGMAVPLLLQADYQKTICVYDEEPRSVASSGCGAVCLSMALTCLAGGDAPAPDVIFRQACLDGQYKGNGLGCAALSDIMRSYGFGARWTGKFYDTITAALTAGYPVIACMGKGWFTGGGHYIVLRGLTEDGKVLVNDPGSAGNSARGFEMRFLFRQAKGGSPFLVCTPPGAR